MPLQPPMLGSGGGRTLRPAVAAKDRAPAARSIAMLLKICSQQDRALPDLHPQNYGGVVRAVDLEHAIARRREVGDRFRDLGVAPTDLLGRRRERPDLDR